MIYSATTGGFYEAGFAPGDGVEISSSEYAVLLYGQANGKFIAADQAGCPVLVDPPLLSPVTLAKKEREWRDLRLYETDALIARHRDELESQAATTLSDADYSALQAYRCDLRNWPKSRKFPAVADRPVLRMTSSTTGAAVKRKRVRKPLQATESA
ncbi:phage tail protein [Pseudomonas chlororaphis]|uniref:phage tail protein n=1 Tax=Pseudomonas chlororaphis TaxID=587753 RepID=UPI0039E24CC2